MRSFAIIVSVALALLPFALASDSKDSKPPSGASVSNANNKNEGDWWIGYSSYSDYIPSICNQTFIEYVSDEFQFGNASSNMFPSWRIPVKERGVVHVLKETKSGWKNVFTFNDIFKVTEDTRAEVQKAGYAIHDYYPTVYSKSSNKDKNQVQWGTLVSLASLYFSLLLTAGSDSECYLCKKTETPPQGSNITRSYNILKANDTIRLELEVPDKTSIFTKPWTLAFEYTNGTKKWHFTDSCKKVEDKYFAPKPRSSAGAIHVYLATFVEYYCLDRENQREVILAIAIYHRLAPVPLCVVILNTRRNERKRKSESTGAGRLLQLILAAVPTRGAEQE
ncbi:hypothetical protein T439DRAFT_333246 [Meredithblackwellia eburnea MCA 4105]